MIQMRQWKNISSIIPADDSTWRSTSVLTLDIDWAPDYVLQYCIDLVEEACVPATWFVTHSTPVIDRLRENPLFELGVHPNFNPLLLDPKSSCRRDAADTIRWIKDIVPEATALRSHSMTTSSRLLDLMGTEGITHEANYFIPWDAHIDLCPWEIWNGITRVPYCWEDDIHILSGWPDSISDCCMDTSLRVYDFHPIHVFLNTESLKRYEDARHCTNDPTELESLVYKGFGTRDRLTELLCGGAES